MSAPDGLVVVDKPAGWTSHDVVGRLRRLAATRRVGHAGTLDPMATGVLVAGVGRATRLLTHLVGADKEYAATVRLGVATLTDDAEGEPTSRADASGVTRADLLAAVADLSGPIAQVPSAVSAVKVDGRRSYARVRAGETVDLPPRPVVVHAFEVLAVRDADDAGVPVRDVDVRVACSSGTYVRALARDLGSALGVGGHLTALRRTSVGPFGVDAASTLDQLERHLDVLTPAEAARAAFAVREVGADEARDLSHGRRIPTGVGTGRPAGRPVAAIGPDGVLVALLEDDGQAARPVLVLTPA